MKYDEEDKEKEVDRKNNIAEGKNYIFSIFDKIKNAISYVLENFLISLGKIKSFINLESKESKFQSKQFFERINTDFSSLLEVKKTFDQFKLSKQFINGLEIKGDELVKIKQQLEEKEKELMVHLSKEVKSCIKTEITSNNTNERDLTSDNLNNERKRVSEKVDKILKLSKHYLSDQHKNEAIESILFRESIRNLQSSKLAGVKEYTVNNFTDAHKKQLVDNESRSRQIKDMQSAKINNISKLDNTIQEKNSQRLNDPTYWRRKVRPTELDTTSSATRVMCSNNGRNR